MTGPHDLFRSGSIDTVALVVMTLSVLVAYRTVRRTGHPFALAG